MARPLFERVVVPVANREDANATARAVTPYLDSEIGELIAVHVIEKAGGAPDKASVEHRQLQAEDIFSILAEGLADPTFTLETEILYGTDIAQTIVDGAHEADASAIVFTPRGGSKWMKLLTSDVSTGLINASDIPILVLPDAATA